MNIVENVCPVCKHKNEVEAVVCVNCGTALADPFADPGAKTKTSDMPSVDPALFRVWPVDKGAVPDSGIAFYVDGTSKPFYTEFRSEFVLGRRADVASEGLLDLAPWGGYHLGLSRRHAMIRRTEEGYEVIDLGSINGTWLNEERLVPHQPYPLISGSHLRLGQMQLFVQYGAREKQ